MYYRKCKFEYLSVEANLSKTTYVDNYPGLFSSLRVANFFDCRALFLVILVPHVVDGKFIYVQNSLKPCRRNLISCVPRSPEIRFRNWNPGPPINSFSGQRSSLTLLSHETGFISFIVCVIR